ncbi:MAG: chromate resistance protein ChrB domain-containing protein [Promethearchaeota archaeon]
MKWVTRDFVHVDRTACPWLIKYFVDKDAEFTFLPDDEIKDFVEKEKAIPFDCSAATELRHHGSKCSFDAIIDKHELKDEALHELAKIIRAADTGKKLLVPESIGLEMILDGVSMGSKDDHEAIAKTKPIFDGFYAACKLKLIRQKYKSEMSKMSKREKREFLRKKMSES